MAQDITGSDHEKSFARIYNDTVMYPALKDVAAALGLTRKTVRNFSAILRRRFELGLKVPALVWRGTGAAPIYSVTSASSVPAAPTPAEHAAARASKLQGLVGGLFQFSRYPVTNPEALVIQKHTSRRYDRVLGDYVETESAPRTWLTDTLRVAGISDVRGRTFIFTGAQNDAELHEGFWDNLQAYAEHVGGEVIVGPWTYETNWWDENNPVARDYDSRIMSSLCFGQMELGDNFVFCGEMNTLPTSPRPIADLTSYGQGRWAVYPHARLQLLSVPSTDPTEQAHQIMTTGACTKPKVIPRKAGIKSIFHHIIGATIVEFDQDGDIFCRQINASEDGSFYDLNTFVDGGMIATTGRRVRAITFADIHVAKLSKQNALATFGFDYQTGSTASDSILEELCPEHVFIEDIHDQESRNHHREKDVSHDYEMAVRGRESVQGEVQRTVDFLTLLNQHMLTGGIHVVESNHDVALERYVREGRYRLDGINYHYGLRLDLAYHDWRKSVAAALDAGTKPTKFSLLEWAVRDIVGTTKAISGVSWIYDGNDSFRLDGIEVGHHGHRGANGSHGTAGGFAKLGRKMTIGDKHTPQILDGVFVAGTMELQHGYNKGPSGWCVSHVVQYPNGKRALITLQHGKWRAKK